MYNAIHNAMHNFINEFPSSTYIMPVIVYCLHCNEERFQSSSYVHVHYFLIIKLGFIYMCNVTGSCSRPEKNNKRTACVQLVNFAIYLLSLNKKSKMFLINSLL